MTDTNLKEKVKSVITFDKTYDDSEEEVETVENETKSVWWNYGLCDLFDIRFTAKSDLHAHLESDHGSDTEDLEEL